MNYSEAMAVIKEHLDAGVTWVAPAPLIVKANVRHAMTEAQDYVELIVPSVDGLQRSMGTVGHRRYQFDGEAHFACYTALGIGEARVLAMTDAIAAAYVPKNIDGVRFRQSSLIDKGKTQSRYFLVLGITFDYYGHL